MGEIRIATFNVENLLNRFDFYRYGSLTRERAVELLGVDDPEEQMQLRKALFVALTDDSRQMTAQAIADSEADLICLQEVEDRNVLDVFEGYYLKSTGVHYGWRRVSDGNDRRGISVAAMSKTRIDVDSNAEITFDDFGLFTSELADYGLSPGDRLFRRDCYEVEVKVNSTELTLFVCHFKSMSGGRDHTKPVRDAEARAARKLVEDKFGSGVADAPWLIVGDLNDYTHESDGTPVANGLEALFEGNFGYNLLERIPPQERWTHYYPEERSFHEIDYIIASPAIYQQNPNAVPEIIRQGQPYRVPGLESLQRYPRTGYDRPKASDHCPVAVTLTV